MSNASYSAFFFARSDGSKHTLVSKSRFFPLLTLFRHRVNTLPYGRIPLK